MAYISSDGSISSGGPSVQSGSAAGGSDSSDSSLAETVGSVTRDRGSASSSSSSSSSSSGSDDETSPFDRGYSGNAVVAEDGSLIGTPGTQITQVGDRVEEGPGQLTGAATVEEAKEAVAEVGGDPSEVGELVENENADSDGPVLELESETKTDVNTAEELFKQGIIDVDQVSQVAAEFQENKSIAETVGSVTRERDSPLAEEDEPKDDFNPTETVVGDGDGGSDYSVTGTVDEDVSNADNTGPQTVPGVSGAGSGGFGIVGVGGIIALIGVVGYLMTQE